MQCIIILYTPPTYHIYNCDPLLIIPQARAWAGAAGAGVEASANLVDLKASVFDLKIGLAADSKIGIKDDSATVGVGGTSITLGRKIGISFGGTGFGIDFGRIFK